MHMYDSMLLPPRECHPQRARKLFARDRESGNMTALVSVTISFVAIEDGGMEDVEAVGNLRAATAVFFLKDQRWETLGRAIFNLEPTEAIQRFQHTLEQIRD